MDEAAKCDRVVVIDSGNILLDGTPRLVFSNVAVLKEVGLDVPQATELAFELRKCGYNLPDDILTEDECVEAILSLIK